MIEKISRVALADQVADALLERVRSGEWPLGSKLPGENALAPQFGVSRSTVREAIRVLAGHGVLNTRQGAGVFVTALDIAEDWSTVLTQAAVSDVIECRVALETSAAALAAERRAPADLRSMRRMLSARQSTLEREDYVDADMRFHRSVVQASHNSVMVELFDSFVPRVRQTMVEMLRYKPVAEDMDHNGHHALVEAIARRDVTQAAHLSQVHLRGLQRGLRLSNS